MELGDYFLANNPQVSAARVEIEEKAWERMMLTVRRKQRRSNSAARRCKQYAPSATSEHEEWSVNSGVDGLVILKTTKSGFTGYIKDKLTTLKPATDRIFGTRATAVWEFAAGSPDYAQVRARVIAAMLKEFAAHNSMSVQHTLFDMGKAALAAAPEIARITLTMPNLHHLLADLSPFGQDNPNHIFVPIDDPHGYIEATIER